MYNKYYDYVYIDIVCCHTCFCLSLLFFVSFFFKFFWFACVNYRKEKKQNKEDEITIRELSNQIASIAVNCDMVIKRCTVQIDITIQFRVITRNI